MAIQVEIKWQQLGLIALHCASERLLLLVVAAHSRNALSPCIALQKRYVVDIVHLHGDTVEIKWKRLGLIAQLSKQQNRQVLRIPNLQNRLAISLVP